MIHSPKTVALSIVLCIAVISSCTSKRPAAYPNEKLKRDGQAQFQADIDECVQLANDHGVINKQAGKIAKETARDGVAGAAAGAVISAITGGNVGQSAAAGAAGGGVIGLIRGLFDSGEPTPVFRQYIDKCLRDKGYEVIGWQEFTSILKLIKINVKFKLVVFLIVGAIPFRLFINHILQPFDPRIKTFFSAGGNLKNGHSGMHLTDIIKCRFQIVIQVGKQINFI